VKTWTSGGGGADGCFFLQPPKNRTAPPSRVTGHPKAFNPRANHPRLRDFIVAPKTLSPFLHESPFVNCIKGGPWLSPAAAATAQFQASKSLRRLIAFRDDGREDRFFDVDFAALQADPIGAVETLYSDMGDELTPETRQRMLEWWEASAAERRSARVDPSAFGLDPAAVREQFDFYHDRFGLR